MDVVLVERLQRLQEAHLRDHLHGRGPVVVDHLSALVLDTNRLHVPKHAHSLQHDSHRWRRVSHSLDLGDLFGGQRVQGLERIVQRRHGLTQRLLAIQLDGVRALGRLRGYGLVRGDDLLDLFRLGRLFVHHDHHLSDLLVLLDELWLQRNEILLHALDGLFCGRQLLKADFVLGLQSADHPAFIREELLEGLDQFQEGRRRGVIDSLQLYPKAFAEDLRVLVE
mmetsp:Transcript_49837/g.161248  ORF Transcript_49837/g.161248 Transcript_49837/m.161248 type:complete len:224 (+) Transcript_49837:3867-4538(+)